MQGRCSLTRYADDFVMVFQNPDDCRRVERVLPKRFGVYGLTLHPGKDAENRLSGSTPERKQTSWTSDQL